MGHRDPLQGMKVHEQLGAHMVQDLCLKIVLPRHAGIKTKATTPAQCPQGTKLGHSSSLAIHTLASLLSLELVTVFHFGGGKDFFSAFRQQNPTQLDRFLASVHTHSRHTHTLHTLHTHTHMHPCEQAASIHTAYLCFNGPWRYTIEPHAIPCPLHRQRPATMSVSQAVLRRSA